LTNNDANPDTPIVSAARGKEQQRDLQLPAPARPRAGAGAIMIWREKRVLLIVLAVLLTANTLFFFTYRVQYERRLQDFEDRRQLAEAQLLQARSTRMTAEGRVAAYRAAQRDIDSIYNDQWSTESERLIPFITEVKRLAALCELVPPGATYTQTLPKKSNEVKSRAETVAISFSVKGNYQQIRRLINLLELSRQFVIIDQIAFGSADPQGQLSLNFTVKTLFRDTSPAGSKQL
jgi:hypothetical protein